MDQEFMERREVEDSLRFYVMFSIMMAAGEYAHKSQESLNAFIKLLKERNYSEDKINTMISHVSSTLPLEFRSIYGIPGDYKM